MNHETNMAAIEAAEKAGLLIPVTEEDYPLDPEISPARCEVVAEARRLAEIIATRPPVPPDGVVYRHSAKELTAALTRALRVIKKEMKHAKPASHSKRRPESGSEEGSDDSGIRDSREHPSEV